MTRRWIRIGWVLIAVCGVWSFNVAAETIDLQQTATSQGAVAAVATLTVTPRNISDNTTASGINFGTVTVGASPWVRAAQYLRIQYQSNNTTWAVRIVTNNKAAFPTMVGNVTDPAPSTPDPSDTNTDPADDKLAYGGMIGSLPTNPIDRVPLVWQVYKDNVVGGPPAPTSDADMNDLNQDGIDDSWKLPWAFIADVSDCIGVNTCRTATPVTIDKTGEYFQVVYGGPLSSAMRSHPNDNNRLGDNDIALYVAGRFGGAPADPSYRATIIFELYHL